MRRLSLTRSDGFRVIGVGIATTLVAFVLFTFGGHYLVPAWPGPRIVLAVVLSAAEILGVLLVLVGLYALTGRLDRNVVISN